jgi:hypothetical protein
MRGAGQAPIADQDAHSGDCAEVDAGAEVDGGDGPASAPSHARRKPAASRRRRSLYALALDRQT